MTCLTMDECQGCPDNRPQSVKQYTVCACTGTSFSAPFIIQVKLLLLFYRVIFDSYQENLVLGGKECSSCREMASHVCILLYHCMHCITCSLF
jgi:hypothetical protein